MLKAKKRSFSMILTLLLILAFAVSAQAAPEKNAAGYYEIASAEDMTWFQQHVAAGNVTVNAKLINNIDLSSVTWKPIWSSNAYEASPVSLDITNLDDYGYHGTFDGNGKTVTLRLRDASLQDVVYNNNRSSAMALFLVLGSDGVVKNLSVTGSVHIENDFADSSIRPFIAPIVAFSKGAVYKVHVSSLSAHSAVASISGSVSGLVAELVGAYDANDAKAIIDSCVVDTTTVQSDCNVTGAIAFIAGRSHYHAIIKNCSVSNSNGYMKNTGQGGGIAGIASYGIIIRNNHVDTVEISTLAGATDPILMTDNNISFGGIVGGSWSAQMRSGALTDVVLTDLLALIEDCSVSNLTLRASVEYADTTRGSRIRLGGIIGYGEGLVDLQCKCNTPGKKAKIKM